MDRRKNNGGARRNAGRKPKADEVALIERLSPMDDIAFDKLKAGLDSGEYQFIKMFFEYRFGKPQDKIDVTSNGESITAIKVVDVDGTEI